jgi:hypothetical protein
MDRMKQAALRTAGLAVPRFTLKPGRRLFRDIR